MTVTTEIHPGWSVQLAIHRAVRRDLARLATAFDADVPASADAIRAYWADFASALHHHHEFEDTVAWPLLARRLEGRADALLARNAAQHASMSAALDACEAAIASMTTDRSAARERLADATDAINSHLDDEEADVLPLIPGAIDADDVAYFMAESAKLEPPEVFLPWVLDDAADADVAFFARVVPPPVHAALEGTWLPNRRMRLDSVAVTGRLGVVAALEGAYARATALAAELDPHDLERPTPCAGWDVRAVLNHLLGTMRMFAIVNEGGVAGEDAGDLVGDDAHGAVQEGVRVNLRTWRAPKAFDGDRSFPFGTFPASAAALMNLSEVIVHTWDVGQAIGRDVTVDPAAAELLVSFYERIPLDVYREHGAFGPLVEVPPDAPAFDRLLGLLGRQPA